MGLHSRATLARRPFEGPAYRKFSYGMIRWHILRISDFQPFLAARACPELHYPQGIMGRKFTMMLIAIAIVLTPCHFDLWEILLKFNAFNICFSNSIILRQFAAYFFDKKSLFSKFVFVSFLNKEISFKRLNSEINTTIYLFWFVLNHKLSN